MTKREENICKRMDDRREGRLEKGRAKTGTIRYGPVYAKTCREVKTKRTAAKPCPSSHDAAQDQECSFREVLLLWLEQNRIRLKATTLHKYQYLIQAHILPDLGEVKLSKLTAVMINSFLSEKLRSGRIDKQGGLSSSYVRSIMLIISAAVKFAVAEQMCYPLRSPIYKPQIPKRELTVLTQAEQKRLEEYLLTGIDATRIGILISLHTGLRIGEICALSWEDVDLKGRLIHVRHTAVRIKNSSLPGPKTTLVLDSPKTRSSLRDIPISSVLMPFLEEAASRSYSDFVASDSAHFVDPRTFEYRYHKLLDACGLGSLNYHMLRHTFATRCIEAGMDVKTLSEILGHANVSVTLNTYVHPSLELKRSQMEKVAGFLR